MRPNSSLLIFPILFSNKCVKINQLILKSWYNSQIQRHTHTAYHTNRKPIQMSKTDLHIITHWLKYILISSPFSFGVSPATPLLAKAFQQHTDFESPPNFLSNLQSAIGIQVKLHTTMADICYSLSKATSEVFWLQNSLKSKQLLKPWVKHFIKYQCRCATLIW